ncbi:LON peptidase substrate-binding domain-containing protein [Pseudoxanthomonas sp. JBR18]|uniref:LON peptidase substrate-binding domain-containing protein n=1 Tax=Pseudoxanthomonas sp. JBR18 TaxID=2969308 RepID=UPI002304F003|nr:LON peptidase substrate-binding domain-containing protein [Pseudoxanthomonas sp. JBR18]WCE04763.1 LON peptidase substrate-binding domain-containing protein [Pseudoxanthomonas sp. JBR18]
MPATESLPLFPLHTVLLPGAGLGLRVFERRYLDLIRECGRSGKGFGVCLILDGEEAGTPAAPAAYGTEATIEDFGTGEDGLLNLRLRGGRRFHVQRTRVRDNGLVVGEVDWCEPEPDDELRPEHGLLATVLEKIFEKAGATPPGMTPRDLDSAAWVGWRLAELLPLSDAQRLAVLQEDDPHARLDHLLALMA